MRLTLFCAALLVAATAYGAASPTDAALAGPYLSIAPLSDGGQIHDFRIAGGVNLAGSLGFLIEGFGFANPYVPSRRINENLEETTLSPGMGWVYSYDCEGSTVGGLHVTRTMELAPNEASLRVRWRIENKGNESRWIAPWVRNDVTPGGTFSASDRIDAPTVGGVQRITRSGYHAASRNWIAATSPAQTTSVYGVFNADTTHSFLGIFENEKRTCQIQTCFVPRLLEPNASWETVYRINAVRGLKRVDFASEEIAVELNYAPGALEVLLASVKSMDNMGIYASVVGENGRVWRLVPKRFDAGPDRVVRCTFDWSAPADGKYDFMAQLKDLDDSSIVKLNSESSTPHGGIDTQFVVGAARSTSMAAWTDAPYALERGRRVIKRPLVTRTPADVWIENSLEKVFPNDVAEPIGSPGVAVARVGLARNERESFQIVMRPREDAPLDDVRFEVSDLMGPSVIAAANVDISIVQNYRVRIPSFFEGPTGETPDILLPYKPFQAPGGRSTSVWFTLYAPHGVPAGLYRGTITMSTRGASAVQIPVEVEVYDFVLPTVPSLKTDFVYVGEHAAHWASRVGCTLSSAQLAQHYSANAQEHRVTLRAQNEFPGPDPLRWNDRAHLETSIADRLANGVTTFAVPETLRRNPAVLAQADAFLRTSMARDRVFCQIAAEPPPATWPEITELCKQWNGTAPHIPLMATTFGYGPFLSDEVDIWAVNSAIFDTDNNQRLLERIRNGHETWLYVNRFNARPYANFLLDFAAIEHRVFFWQAWALGIKGIHYWAINYAAPEQNPYQDQLDLTPVNGDGFLVYPGPNGPLNSIRWEVIRDGIEDHDYLCMFRELLEKVRARGGHETLVNQALREIDHKKVVPDLTNFPRDPQVLVTARRNLARYIEKLSEAAR